MPVVDRPPFIIKEQGWAGFDVLITLQFKDKREKVDSLARMKDFPAREAARKPTEVLRKIKKKVSVGGCLPPYITDRLIYGFFKYCLLRRAPRCNTT